MSGNPEIAKLQSLFAENDIVIKVLGKADKDYSFWVELKVNGHLWKLYVDDEFGDLSNAKPVMGLFLILSTLLEYSDAEDYLEWCKVSNIESNDAWLDYYRSLAQTTRELEQQLGSLDPIISQYDYTMNTGVAEELRSL